MRNSWGSRAVVALCGVVACSGAGAVGGTGAVAAVPGSTSFAGTPRVGALFPVGPGSRRHFCTASVVDSRRHDLIVTAAHCLSGGAVFVPGYRDGRAPYGRWRLGRVFVDPRWSRSHDPDYDVAFATTSPGGRRVQDVVGSEAIRFRPPSGTSAVAVGYPSRAERPVHCGAALSVFRTARQLRFACPGLPGGTSGGPLLTGTDARANGRGAVVGVIGGFQQGGRTADVSYSSWFGPGVAALYRRAAAW
jgi:hypothetical protein